MPAVPKLSILSLVLMSSLAAEAGARGASPYLSLHLSPEIERQFERVLILAGRPVLTRPLAAATVLDALPAACERDPLLCAEVKRHLDGYAGDYGMGYLQLGASSTNSESISLPNRHGMRSDSPYEVSGQVYWQPADQIVVAAGFLAYDGDSGPTGTLLSIGNEFLQLDVGYRDHWLSPMSDSSMLIGTQAPTMPSLSISNYTPLARFGFRYEAFIAEMGTSQNIASGSGFTTGEPRLAGLHMSIEPFPGWSIGINRIMQFGGGDRPDSFRDLADAFFRPSEFDNSATGSDRSEEFGNQAASITASYLHTGGMPFSVYFEYAGEDTSKNSNLYLGNSGLSFGVRMPALNGRFDLTAEFSEWQNAWYVHGIYQDGLSNEGHVIGHWAADWRQQGDGVGGRSLMTRVGWQLRGGALFEATFRVLQNESYTAPDYVSGRSFEMSYSRRWGEFFVGAELDAGEDVFGRRYSRLGAFIRF
jgi:hypothetical protein